MKPHRLERSQLLDAKLAPVFSFFKDPKNLERITPPWLSFRVVWASDPEVRQGTGIRYRLRWHVLPTTWESLITEYEENTYFADEMVSGPYRRWYHRHLFRETAGGVDVRDEVEYELPFGPLGALAHVIVRRQLGSIFDYRARIIASIFDQGR